MKHSQIQLDLGLEPSDFMSDREAAQLIKDIRTAAIGIGTVTMVSTLPAIAWLVFLY